MATSSVASLVLFIKIHSTDNNNKLENNKFFFSYFDLFFVGLKNYFLLLLAVEEAKSNELKELKEKFDIESQVRKRAESFAAELYGENKSFKVLRTHCFLVFLKFVYVFELLFSDKVSAIDRLKARIINRSWMKL